MSSSNKKLCDCKTGKHVIRTLIVVDDAWYRCPRCGGFIKRPKQVLQKDGRCHAHCQVGCRYKVCGTCTYDGDDGCEGQYVHK